MYIFTIKKDYCVISKCGFQREKTYLFVTTVHKDVTERLVQINPALASQARKVLDVNKSERHIRGGLATREKYLHQKGAV